MSNDDDDVGRLFDAVAAELSAPGGAAGDWLLAHAREFAEALDKFRRPNWTVISEQLLRVHGIGHTDAQGNAVPLKGDALRVTWYRVREFLASRGEDWVEFGEGPRGSGRFVKKQKRGRGGKSVACAPAAPAAPDIPEGMFSKRSWVPTVTKPATPAEPAEPAITDPQLLSLMDEMSASRPWVPKAGR